MSTVESTPTTVTPAVKPVATKPAAKKLVAHKETASNGKPATKKIVKKASPKAQVKEKPAESDAEKSKAVKDRALGKSVGLGLIHFRVLRALKGTRPGSTLTYRGIEKKTGYYAPLAEIMHTERAGEGTSLVAKGLARLEASEGNEGRTHVAFCITAKGTKLVEKASLSE